MQKAVAVALVALAVLWVVAQPFLTIGVGVDIPVAATLPVSVMLGACGIVLWMRAGQRSSSEQGDGDG
mgnify:CR=1 FL=1